MKKISQLMKLVGFILVFIYNCNNLIPEMPAPEESTDKKASTSATTSTSSEATTSSKAKEDSSAASPVEPVTESTPPAPESLCTTDKIAAGTSCIASCSDSSQCPSAYECGPQNTCAPLSADSLTINAGATHTNQTSVSLTFNPLAGDKIITELWITNSSDCNSGGSWEAYTAQKSWTLAHANARNVVLVKYRDASLAESSCTTGSIIHDNTPPSVPTGVKDSKATDSDSARISWQVSLDSGGSASGLSTYEVSVGLAAGDSSVASWTETSATTYDFSDLALSPGTTYYGNVRAVDKAGNRSKTASGDGWIAQFGF
jgi:hypothetical protein